MKKYCVSYTIDYHHRVVVGCEAVSEAHAIEQAQTAFDCGEIWEDTEAMPLLFDDYEEVEGETLVFSAEEVAEFPKPDASVFNLKRRELACKACWTLLAGDTGTAIKLATQAAGLLTYG